MAKARGAKAQDREAGAKNASVGTPLPTSAPPTRPRSGGVGRIVISDVVPRGGLPGYPARSYVGELLSFGATVFREGHDVVGAAVILTAPDGEETRLAMTEVAPGTDRFEVQTTVTQHGNYRFRVVGFGDEWASWVRLAEVKLPASMDVDIVREVGARLLDRARTDPARPGEALAEIGALSQLLRDKRSSVSGVLSAIRSPNLDVEFSLRPCYQLSTQTQEGEIAVARSRAGVGSWYEFFPRSEGAVQGADGQWKSGTFQSARKRLVEVAGMGFDVVYLPPIHPIGVQHRKGKNNALVALPGDPGSPWAIGAAEGGHDAVHPDLGTLNDFRDFVSEAARLGLEIALDLALQASPDHPWLTEHPEWFHVQPDGSIAFAENPPKKYQDIYPLNFDNDPDGLCHEVLRIVQHWISQGVRIFRVDNPHTKPLWFWEWLITAVRRENPDVVFLAEAFTRPAPMYALAAVGFDQSYSYFSWRNSKAELSEFFDSISRVTADFYHPNLWVNTPDILTEYLQHGGRPAFTVRATLAATAAPLWGVYSGFELFESIARPGAEEAADNEKYEYRPRDFAGAEAAGNSLALYLGLLNRIRREHPAFGQFRNLRLQHTQDDAIIAYTKFLAARHSPRGVDDRLLIIVNVDPHHTRETRVYLNRADLELDENVALVARDLVTGETWPWPDSAFVRLDQNVRPAHIFEISVAE